MVMWEYRADASSTVDLIPLFKKGLEACQVKAGEDLMIYRDHQTPPHYAAAFVSAGLDLGANVFQITIPNNQADILEGPVWDIWHKVNIVIDLESIATSIYRPLRVSALAAGVRVLRITEPEDVLFRLPPDENVRERVKVSESLVERAAEMHVTSPAGTDMVVNIKNRKAFGLWGAAEQSGVWAHWSVGVVVGGANRDRTNGAIIIDVGDVLLGLQRYVNTPIEVIVEEGIITSINGGLDAQLLRSWFEGWKDERAYYIYHIGWGCDPRAEWNRLGYKRPGGIGDVESVNGVFQIAFGRDTSWYIGGGKNDTPAHMDFNCLNCSIVLDKKLITEEGAFVHEDLR